VLQTQLAVWFSCGTRSALQAVARPEPPAARNSPAPTRSSLSGGCMAAKKSPKVKDLPRKAIDPKKAANVKGGLLAKPRKPSN